MKSLSNLLKRPSQPLQRRLPILLATVRKSLHTGLTSSAQEEVSQNLIQPVTNSVAVIDTQDTRTCTNKSFHVQVNLTTRFSDPYSSLLHRSTEAIPPSNVKQQTSGYECHRAAGWLIFPDS
jgi:hypothetical protein